MRVLVTGANGFIGKNLLIHLQEKKTIEIVTLLKNEPASSLSSKLDGVDFVFHLAGINRPLEEKEFIAGNTNLTKDLCAAIKKTGRKIPVIYTSSAQAEIQNAYGASKKDAENALVELHSETGSLVYIYRLPNVFGKWCRPNYNSAVATFCHNIANGLPVTINDPKAEVKLVYVDDVVKAFVKIMEELPVLSNFPEVHPVYKVTVGELVKEIQSFRDERQTSLVVGSVGVGFARALYATYISYLRPEQFSYKLIKHEDSRGEFVEMLKTKESGQFSYFTAHPGITRGGHYHHTKTEKFLVVKGKALFRFLHLTTGEKYEYYTSSAVPEIVDTIPGWSHDITNVGDDEMIVLLWANEVFVREHPDTVSHKVV